MPKKVFKPEDKDRPLYLIIKEVEKRPFLYHPKHRGLGNNIRQINETWDEIGGIVGLSGPVCKEKWSSVRNVFGQILRANKERRPNEKKIFYLSEALEFLVPYININPSQPKKPCEEGNEEELEYSDCPDCSKLEKESDIEEDIIVLNSDNNLRRFLETPGKKKKRKTKRKKPKASSDTVGLYLNSLEPELHAMNENQLERFKEKVFNLVDGIMTPTDP